MAAQARTCSAFEPSIEPESESEESESLLSFLSESDEPLLAVSPEVPAESSDS